MSRDRSTPPRLAQSIVRMATPDPRWREVMLGDLGEEFAALASARGLWIARIWYWQQALAIAAQSAAHSIARRVPRPGDRPMRTLLQDASRGLRAISRQPLVTGVIIVTLALALGANAATFGMIDSLVLRPFQIASIDRLVLLSETSPANFYLKGAISPPMFRDISDRARTLDHTAAFAWWDVNLSGGDRPERVQGFNVSADFFSIVGASVIQGRLLDAGDMAEGQHRVVISDGLWRRRFAADPGILGRTIRLDGEPYAIVGVAGRGFDFPDGSEIWAPLTFTPDVATKYSSRFLTVIGRRAPGVSLEQVSQEMSQLYTQEAAQHPDEMRHYSLVSNTFSRGMLDEGTPQILFLWQAAAMLVLLIGCTNITSLLLAAGAERRRELAMRLALGAGRGRLIRQLLAENLIVAAIALPAALGVAAVVLHLIKAAMPAAIVRFVAGWNQMGVDARVVGFTVIAALATVLLFGLLPAFQASRLSLTSALRDGGRTGSAGPGRNRLRRILVAAEIALALPLLIVSTLAAVGAQRFASGPQGYDPSGLYRVRIELPDPKYKEISAQRQFAKGLLEEATRVPGVERVATTTVAPATSSNQARVIAIEGHDPNPGDEQVINFRAVSTGYLETMHIPVLQGRRLDDGDREDNRRVAVISQSLARAYWSGGSALDRRIRIGRDATEWTTIVGVVGDTVDDWFDSRRVPTIYVPVTQAPDHSIVLIARSSADPAALAPGLRDALLRVDPDIAPYGEMTMPDAIRERTVGLRFIGALMTAFGLLALLLAAFGIYAVMAHHVQQRRQEIGIRMALGAAPGAVLWTTLGNSLRLAAIGASVGLVAAIALARVMESALFGIVGASPALFAAVTMTLLVVAMTASLLPARRATRVDPVTALRE